MSVTVTYPGSASISSATTEIDYVAGMAGQPIIITFSDGTEIAIVNYDDKEVDDMWVARPAVGGSVDEVNIGFATMNGSGLGATFGVQRSVSGVPTGATLYTFLNISGTEAVVQFLYDNNTQTLTIDRDIDPVTDGSFAACINADGTLTPSFVSENRAVIAICYLRGTPIMTDRGEVPVERLQPDDMVLTRDRGMCPVRWIGVQRFDARLVGQRGAPVRFRAGSLGPNVPHTDLLVSPAHAMLVDDHLVAASMLLNDVTIVQQSCEGEIEYYHVELDQHDCLLAAGAWGESYWENAGNRAYFHASLGTSPQADDAHAQPRPTCRPLVNTPDHPRLAALRAMITPRLAPGQLTADPDLRMETTTGRVTLMRTGSNTWQGIVPAGHRGVRLRSRSARPSMVSEVADHRRLGLCLHAIELTSGGRTVSVPLDHPSLARGFHGVERDGQRIRRWTDGDAWLPLRGLIDATQPVMVTIRGHHQPRNLVEDDATASSRAVA